MISLTEAITRVLAVPQPLDVVDLPLEDARGAVLREDLVARGSTPPFDASAMDGYALRSSDVSSAASRPVELEVVATSSCGRPSEVEVVAGTATRILTGAVVPPGADCVVPLEHTDGGTGRVAVRASAAPGGCIRRRGEVSGPGDVLVASGTVLSAGHLSLAAGEGCTQLRVTRPPRVAVVSTGDELVAPGGGPLGAGRIYDSNGTLMAQLAASAGCAVQRHTSGDDPAQLAGLLERLAGSVDVILTSGGVSMGAEFDPLRAALAGHPVEFWQVAVKPAKPFAFGRIGTAIYAGLPGNPVAVVVSFELFVRPLLDRLRGCDTAAPRLVEGVAAHDMELAADDRTHLVPVGRTGSGTWSATELAGSHALAGVAAADALAWFGPEDRRVAAGGPLALLPLWT